MNGSADRKNGSRGAGLCPLCGRRFDEGVESCASCPLHHGCRTICCPHCGYSTAGRSATLELIQRAGRALAKLLSAGEETRRGTP